MTELKIRKFKQPAQDHTEFMKLMSIVWVRRCCFSSPQYNVFYFLISFYNRLWSKQLIKTRRYGGTSVAQSVKCPTLAQVTISRFVGSSPTSGSVLTTQSLELCSDSVSASPCSFPTQALSLPPHPKKVNKH